MKYVLAIVATLILLSSINTARDKIDASTHMLDYHLDEIAVQQAHIEKSLDELAKRLDSDSNLVAIATKPILDPVGNPAPVPLPAPRKYRWPFIKAPAHE
jgi:hypothetical protein